MGRGPCDENDIPCLLTRAEVAEIIGISVKYVDRLIRSGQLGSVRIGRHVRIAPAQLEASLASAERIFEKNPASG